MSEARSITNFIGNAVATVFLAHNEKALDRQLAAAILGGQLPTPMEQDTAAIEQNASPPLTQPVPGTVQ
jgi:aerobic C4-dicarboxylate transport protein